MSSIKTNPLTALLVLVIVDLLTAVAGWLKDSILSQADIMFATVVP